ncbi:MAG TPA: formyltetrahydrofolate deformylase [Solirubrobacteraceae bacterium]|nr:formyltetrahydrofolate deformylase [Solirubrobacteraceae bacterium]
MSANEPAVAAGGRLLIGCADRPGIVAAVSAFLAARGANITASDQHSSDPRDGRFFMRMEFQLAGLDREAGVFERAFAEEVGDRFGMAWRVAYPWRRKRVAILVSHEGHCVLELLSRWRRGQLDAEIVGVIGNHRVLEEEIVAQGVDFAHVATPKGGREQAEAELVDRLAGRCDLLVLARYMQILTGGFLDRLGVAAINIHHSFLPAFPGAAPYRQAHERGVKIIGATAHYVSEELDDGPIIEQDVARVSHRATVADFVRTGADIERAVLARAVRWHVEDRILVDGKKTVVFAGD